MVPDEGLHDRDFFAWTQRQAELLRAGRVAELDHAHLGAELEALAERDRATIRRRMLVLLATLVKWLVQHDLRCRAWASTIRAQRRLIDQALKDSPSLRDYAVALVTDTYPEAVEQAALESGLFADCFPSSCPWTPEQTLDTEFLPRQAGEGIQEITHP